jgi:hypothetical protein
MNSAVQLARELVVTLRAFQERQESARETWRDLIPALERQTEAVLAVFRKALKKGPRVDVRVKSEKLILKFRVRQGAESRFYVDPVTCHVVGERTSFGHPDADDRAKRKQEFVDLGDVQRMSTGAFVEQVIDFLKWASIGKGKGEAEFRFSRRDSS